MKFQSKAKDLLLFLFSLSDHYQQPRIDGRTKMQKIVYLTSSKFDILQFPFIGYHYGPYSKELQNTLNRMVAFNLIREDYERKEVNEQYFYQLTFEGHENAKSTWGKIDQTEKKIICDSANFASELNKKTLQEILPEAYETARKQGIL